MMLKKTFEDALDEAELKSEDIPTIDLYIDQILNLISERLKDGSERYHDRQLTKTMINNYSKEGLITPVKGKKYDKEQILQMLMIYTLYLQEMTYHHNFPNCAKIKDQLEMIY